VVYPEPLEAKTDAAHDNDQDEAKARDHLPLRTTDHRQEHREHQEQISQDAWMDPSANEDERRVSEK